MNCFRGGKPNVMRFEGGEIKFCSYIVVLATIGRQRDNTKDFYEEKKEAGGPTSFVHGYGVNCL